VASPTVRIRIKRVYEPAANTDGRRILIDRLWPRGVSKARARIDFWAKSIAPSNGLRRWYGHEPSKWKEFQSRYRAELRANPDGVRELRREMGRGTVTLVFSSREERLNNAAALKAVLEKRRP